MPALAGLEDEQIADVLTYVRQEFGSKASAVSAADVKNVRGMTANRSEPWTIAELK